MHGCDQGKQEEEDICCYRRKEVSKGATSTRRNKQRTNVHKDQKEKEKHKSNKQGSNTKKLRYAWIMLYILLY